MVGSTQIVLSINMFCHYIISAGKC